MNCIPQASGGKCAIIGNECWCFHDEDTLGYSICGYLSGFKGQYYSIAKDVLSSPKSIIEGLGKTPHPGHCNPSYDCNDDCATNRCDLTGCWGTNLTCWTDTQRWNRKGPGLVRCIHLEGK